MRATMSKIEALTLCQYFARPEVPWVWTPSGPAAEFGTKVHETTRAMIEGDIVPYPHKEDAAVQAVASEAFKWFLAFDAKHDKWLTEPAYVLDPVAGTARMVGTNIGRKYPRVTDNETAGAADIVGIGGDVATCIDLKTGRRENVEPAETNAQLRTLALAVHKAHGAPKVRVVLAFPGAGGVATDEHTLDAYDLAAWEGELAALVQSIPTSKPNPSKKACQYCPAKAACPAMTEALAVAVPSRRLPVVMNARDITSPDHAREQYMTLRAAKSAIDQAWGALRAYADEHGPIDLGDGRAYGPKTSQRESVDLSTRAAVDVLRRELGPAWEMAVELKTTKGAIEDAAREAAKQSGGTITAVKQRTLDALREVGAVSVNKSTTYDEFKKGNEEAA